MIEIIIGVCIGVLVGALLGGFGAYVAFVSKIGDIKGDIKQQLTTMEFIQNEIIDLKGAKNSHGSRIHQLELFQARIEGKKTMSNEN